MVVKWGAGAEQNAGKLIGRIPPKNTDRGTGGGKGDHRGTGGGKGEHRGTGGGKGEHRGTGGGTVSYTHLTLPTNHRV